MAGSATYDYIIVGAGSAGCAMADRPGPRTRTSRVLLLEAGGWDRDPWIHIPLAWGKILQKRLHDWRYFAEPEPSVDGRRVECARGKVIGGSSSINAMAYVRGHRGDYDRWADSGTAAAGPMRMSCPISAARRAGRAAPTNIAAATGRLTTQTCRATRIRCVDAFAAAGPSAGHPATDDYNGARQEGFGRWQATIRDGRRCSAAVAYLRPALARRNSTVETGALATRVVFDGGRARSGSNIVSAASGRAARAEREVILAGGVINSPQLLMLSGIGDPDELRPHWHRRCRCRCTASARICRTTSRPGPDGGAASPGRCTPRCGSTASPSTGQTYFFGTGIAAELAGRHHGLPQEPADVALPDIQFLLTRAARRQAVSQAVQGALQGRLRLPHRHAASGKPGAGWPAIPGPGRRSPILQSFLATDGDWRALRAGVRIVREVASQRAMQPYIAREIVPGEGRPPMRISTPISARPRSPSTIPWAPAAWGPMAMRWPSSIPNFA